MEGSALEILYENNDLIVCVKPAGVLSEACGGKKSMPLLLDALARERGIADARFLSVHRLDREVGGVMVWAKNAPAAAALSDAIRDRKIIKEYLAVVCGETGEEGVLEDLLFRDSRTMKTYIADRMRKGVRQAKLSFRRLGSVETPEGARTLVRVKLYTGRTHQIRVQFASRKTPLCGDGRYGSGDGKDRPALFSARLALPGVFDCTAVPSGGAFDLFDRGLRTISGDGDVTPRQRPV